MNQHKRCISKYTVKFELPPEIRSQIVSDTTPSGTITHLDLKILAIILQ